MTDRKPDDLYDALRDRLANYGQEPPAPLWANIRAQLPPPVAAPQLRQRARKRRLAALALLLLLLSVGTWGGWRLAHRRNTSELAHQPTPGAAPVPSGASVAPAARPASPLGTLAKREEAQPETSRPGAASATVAAGRATAERTGDPADFAAGAATATGQPTAVVARPQAAAVAVVGGAKLSPATATTTSRTRPAGFGTQLPKELPKGRTGKADMRSVARQAGPQQARRAVTVASVAAGNSIQIAANEAIETLATTTGAQEAAQLRSTSRTHAAANPEVAGNTSGLIPPADAGATGAGRTAASQLTRLLPSPTGGTAVAEAGPASESQLGLRQPRLALAALPVPVPAVRTSADTLPFPRPAVFRRWMLQAVAGPALTYRLLGSQKDYSAPAPSSLPPYNTGFNGVQTSTYNANQEQAATGFAATVQVRRQLTGRWGLSAGLGYQEYATSQSITVVTWQRSYSLPTYQPDSMAVQTTRLRDTYRYLTVPVRLSYQLGTGNSRWQYGLLGGADVALYLGGTSSNGISSKQWATSGSPYRALNLALSVGAEVRYRLAPRWEVLAQPTATFFVNSIARPYSGYGTRYPLAASGLLGVSYGLR